MLASHMVDAEGIEPHAREGAGLQPAARPFQPYLRHPLVFQTRFELAISTVKAWWLNHSPTGTFEFLDMSKNKKRRINQDPPFEIMKTYTGLYQYTTSLAILRAGNNI